MSKPEVEIRELAPLEAHLHDKVSCDAALVSELLSALQEISQVAMANGDEWGVALIADVAIAKAMPISTAISCYKLNDGAIGGTAHKVGSDA